MPDSLLFLLGQAGLVEHSSSTYAQIVTESETNADQQIRELLMAEISPFDVDIIFHVSFSPVNTVAFFVAPTCRHISPQASTFDENLSPYTLFENQSQIGTNPPNQYRGLHSKATRQTRRPVSISVMR